jgi:photosystem II stability/assembly factor-like uncharacterized protein
MKRQIFGILLISIATAFFAGDGFSQPNWIQTNGPSGGYLSAIMVDSSNNFYAATTDNGIFWSTNQGKNWEELDSGLVTYELSTLNCGPDSEVYVGSIVLRNVYQFSAKTSQWISASPINLTLPIFAVFKSKTGSIFLTTDNAGVFKITKNGDSVVYSDSGITKHNIGVITGTSDGKLLYAGGDSVAYKSSDDGVSWQKILQTGSIDMIAKLYCNGYSRESSVIYLTSNSNATHHGKVLRSSNEGITWDTLFSGYDVNDIVSIRNNLYICTYIDGIYESTDNGKSWKQENNGLNNAIPTMLAVTKTNDLLAGVYGRGVFRLHDGDTIWTWISSGLSTMATETLVVQGDTIYAGTDNNGMEVSTDRGDTWNLSNEGNRTEVFSLVLTKKRIFYAGTDDGVFISFNLGKKWSKVTGVSGIINTMHLSNQGVIYVALYDSIVYYIVDGDTIAHKITKGIPGLTLRQMTVADDGNLYGVGSYQYLYQGRYPMTHSGLFRSLGDSTGFIQIGNDFVKAQAIGSFAAILLYGFTGQPIMFSSDYGISWNSSNSGNEFPYAFISGKNGRLYSAGFGVLLSVDSGIQWGKINFGNYLCMARDSNDNLYLGSYDPKNLTGGGVFRSSVPGYLLDVKPKYIQPQTNSPNLFLTPDNKFVHLKDNNVSNVKIYNVTGAEVCDFSNVNFDLSSGLNLYDLLKSTGVYTIVVANHSGKMERFLVIKLQ